MKLVIATTALFALIPVASFAAETKAPQGAAVQLTAPAAMTDSELDNVVAGYGRVYRNDYMSNYSGNGESVGAPSDYSKPSQEDRRTDNANYRGANISD